MKNQNLTQVFLNSKEACNSGPWAVLTTSQVFIKRKIVVSHLLQKNWRRLLPVTQSSLASNIRKNEILRFSVFFEEGHVKIDWIIMWDLLSADLCLFHNGNASNQSQIIYFWSFCSRPEFYNLTTNIYDVCTSNAKLTNTNITEMIQNSQTHYIIIFCNVCVCCPFPLSSKTLNLSS